MAGSIWPKEPRNLPNPASRRHSSNLGAETAAGLSASRGNPVSTSAVYLNFPGAPTVSVIGAWRSSRRSHAIRPPPSFRRPPQKPRSFEVQVRQTIRACGSQRIALLLESLVEPTQSGESHRCANRANSLSSFLTTVETGEPEKEMATCIAEPRL